MNKKYRITPKCEVTFSPTLEGEFKGSIGLVVVQTGERHTIYFNPQGCYFADMPEHTGEDRVIFEEALRNRVLEYWSEQVPLLIDAEAKALRINYPANTRRVLAAHPKTLKLESAK